jgi:hypothetical protein
MASIESNLVTSNILFMAEDKAIPVTGCGAP